MGDIEKQLHARVALLDVLPTRTAGPAETERQLTLGDRQPFIDHDSGLQVVDVRHLPPYPFTGRAAGGNASRTADSRAPRPL